MREEREERAAGAMPAEEGEEAAPVAEAIRRVFDEALREAIPAPSEGEAEGETPGP